METARAGEEPRDSMTPVEHAAAVYGSEACARTFREDLEAHLFNGYVFNTPDLFVMGRAVNSTADAAAIVDPWHAFESERCDAWLVYLAAGDLGKLIELFPYPLPKIGFERMNKLRFYRFCEFTPRLKRLCTITKTSSAALISTAP
jgi:hypothetical protein